MRFILTALFALAAVILPAAAQDWDAYENVRYGYIVAIPSGFWGQGEADNGDGQVFKPQDGTAELRVYGRQLMVPEFEHEVADSITFHENEGWTIVYQSVTPSWATYSGKRNGVVLFVRMIPLCNGEQSASAEFTYPERDIPAMDDVVDFVATSLMATGRGVSC